MSKLTTEYWFPLRPGLLVNVRLPDDVTHQDVDRLERFLRTGLHYNSLIRLLHAPSTTAAVRDLYLIAQTALMRAKGEEGVAADFYMKETLSNEGRIATYAERIARILREAEDMEVTLLFAPLPSREVGPTVPRGTTFEEALRKDPSLAQRVRRN